MVPSKCADRQRVDSTRVLIVVAAVLAVVIPLVVVGMSPAFASDPADAGSTQAPHSIIPR